MLRDGLSGFGVQQVVITEQPFDISACCARGEVLLAAVRWRHGRLLLLMGRGMADRTMLKATTVRKAQ